jgi:hypothetical protein
MIHCPLCGLEYEATASPSSCQACPLARGCSMACCPRCGYKMPTESRLGKLIKKLTTATGVARED